MRFGLEVGVNITPLKTYIPNLTFLTTANVSQFANDMAIEGAPDLVVEILSPSTGARDKDSKFKTYQQAGVPWYWIVEQDILLIYEYKNTPDGYLVAQVVSTGLILSRGFFRGSVFNLAVFDGGTTSGRGSG